MPHHPVHVASSMLALLAAATAQSFVVPPGAAPSAGACNNYPFATTDMRYQTLVTPADLGNAPTTIHGLALAPCTTGVRVMAHIRVRMAHARSGTLGTTFDSNLTNPGPAVTVLDTSDHHWHLVADTWNAIGLQLPFAYNGSDNLVIDVLVTGSSGDPGAMQRDSTNQRVFLGNYTGQSVGTSTGNMAFRMRMLAGDADVHEYGRGCAGSNGTPQFTLGGTARLGTTLSLDCRSAPPGAPVIFAAGFDNSAPSWPRDLTLFGAPGCVLWHDLLASAIVIANGTGDASLGLGVPAAPAFGGIVLYASAIVFDPGANALSATVTNYGRALLGN